jgi:hypothetical protein
MSISVLVTVIVFGGIVFGLAREALVPSPAPSHVATFAIALFVVTLCVVVYIANRLPWARDNLGYGLGLLPLLTYVGTFAYVQARRRLQMKPLLVAAGIGLIPLWVLGVWLGFVLSCMWGGNCP